MYAFKLSWGYGIPSIGFVLKFTAWVRCRCANCLDETSFYGWKMFFYIYWIAGQHAWCWGCWQEWLPDCTISQFPTFEKFWCCAPHTNFGNCAFKEFWQSIEHTQSCSIILPTVCSRAPRPGPKNYADPAPGSGPCVTFGPGPGSLVFIVKLFSTGVGCQEQ